MIACDIHKIRNSMNIQNALVSNIFDRSQRYFAHVTTVLLSWRVQNIVVIDRVYFTLECFEFSSNFEFDRNMLSGTGAWTGYTYLVPWDKIVNKWSTQKISLIHIDMDIEMDLYKYQWIGYTN